MTKPQNNYARLFDNWIRYGIRRNAIDLHIRVTAKTVSIIAPPGAIGYKRPPK